MTLELNGLAVDCILGDLPAERLRAQRITVDVRLDITDGAAETDDLADTVDYAVLAETIRQALVAAKCRMLERAAKVVQGVCLGDRHVRRAVVRVTKRDTVPGLASASVECG